MDTPSESSELEQSESTFLSGGKVLTLLDCLAKKPESHSSPVVNSRPLNSSSSYLDKTSSQEQATDNPVNRDYQSLTLGSQEENDYQILLPRESQEKYDTEITGADIRQWVRKTDTALARAKTLLDQIDQAGGYDYDTGANALFTWGAVTSEVNALAANADQDCSIVFKTIADTAIRNPRGIIGIVLAQLFYDLAKKIENWGRKTLRPLELVELLSTLDLSTQTCLLPAAQNPPSLEGVLADIGIEMENQPQVLSLEDICSRTWMSTQISFAEEAEENGADARAGVFLLMAATMWDSYLENNHEAETDPAYALEPTLEMLRDLAALNAQNQELGNPGINRESKRNNIYEVAWQGLLDRERIRQLRDRFLKENIYGALSGNPDLLGIGPWQILLRCNRPQKILEMLADLPGYSIVRRTDPAPEPEISANVIMLEKPARLKRPAVMVFTTASGLCAEMARYGAAVVWSKDSRGAKGAFPDEIEINTADNENDISQKYEIAGNEETSLLPDTAYADYYGPDTLFASFSTPVAKPEEKWDLGDGFQKNDLLRMIEGFESEVAQTIVSSRRLARLLHDIKNPLKEKGITLIISEADNELEAFEIARYAPEYIAPELSQADQMAILRARSMEAREGQTSWEIALASLENDIAENVAKDTTLARVLLSANAPANLLGKIQEILLMQAPQIRLDVISGGQGGPSVISFNNLDIF